MMFNHSLVNSHDAVFCECLTFPIASKPLSKKSRMPKNMKATPIPAKPAPISEKTKNNVVHIMEHKKLQQPNSSSK